MKWVLRRTPLIVLILAGLLTGGAICGAPAAPIAGVTARAHAASDSLAAFPRHHHQKKRQKKAKKPKDPKVESLPKQ